MGEMTILRDLAVIFAVAVAVVAVLHRAGIPAIAGYILAGILAGPNGLGFINNVHDVERLAEVGVVLLLFSIGSEFSLERLRSLWRPILIGGMLQVSLTSAVAFLIAREYGYSWQTALLTGWIVSLSSTAVVLRGLEKRGEVDAPHGRLTLGILLFQDLCVVPIMFSIPMLAGANTSLVDLGFGLLRAVLILTCVMAGARIVTPRILKTIAKTRQRDSFILAVLLVCIGTAWIATLSGVSMALGAFLAGLVVADSEYRHQALADLFPFREGFTSLFFISVGMLLHPGVFWQNGFIIFILLAGILLGKMLVVLLAGAVMRLPLRVCILAGVSLAQVGEFSFVLIRAVQGTPLLDDTLAGNITAAVIFSMIVTPFALALGPKLAAGVDRARVLTRILKVKSAVDASEERVPLHDHVIIGGYGFAGQALARSLRSLEIPYVIIELNPDNVRAAMLRNERVYYGDITSEEVLRELGAKQAKEFVIVINDPSAIEKAVAAARRVAPQLHILVRSRYRLDVQSLAESGANEVIPDEVEAAAQVINRVLVHYQVEPAVAAEQGELARHLALWK